MNPVIGLDISKDESHGQAFLERGKPYRGTFKFEHTREGLTKLLQAVQDQVFPTYKGVFGGIYSNISLRFLNEFPTSYLVLQSDEETLMSKFKELLSSRRGRSENWICLRVKRLLNAAKQNPFQQTMYSSHLVNLRVLISLILQYQEHLSRLKENIDALAEEIDEYDLIQSIPGIGPKIAATILSEIGEVDRFDHPKKLVAFEGIDPSVFASGKFTATRNRITLRGSRQLRYALVMAVQCGLIRSRNVRLKDLYDRKRGEGKPHELCSLYCYS